MKYMKKTLYLFIPLLIILFLAKGIVSTVYFKNNLTSILKSSGLNVEFDKVHLDFHKVKIDNLKVMDQAGNLVIDSKRAEARINLLVPTRLLRIDVYDAVVNLERYKGNKFNAFNILKPDDKDKKQTYDKTNRLGRLYFHNSVLNFTDTSFEKRIFKTLNNVNGYLDASKSRGFALEAKGKSGDETLGVKLIQQLNTLQSFKSMFDKGKNSDPKRKNFHLGFEFNNVEITENLGQYVPLNMITAKGGRLNGNLELTDNDSKEVMKVKGQLDIIEGILNYNDYEGDIRSVKASISMTDENIIVNATSPVEESLVTLKIGYNIPEENIKINLSGSNIPFREIAKYKLIKEANIKARGNITADLNINIDQKEKKTEMDGKFSSPLVEIAEYGFSDLNTVMKISKDQVLTLENTSFHFDETVSDFKIKNDVLVPLFSYNIGKKNGNGNYIITNRGSDYSVSHITGTASIDKDNIISGNFDSKEIKGNYVINIKKEEMIVNADGKQYFAINYGGESYDINPNINRLLLKFNSGNMLHSGNMDLKLKAKKNQYFNSIVANIGIKGGNYNVSGIVDAKGEKIRVKGTTTADMYHNYRITSANNGNIDVARLLRSYGYDLKGLDKAKLPVRATANISGKGNKFSGNYEIYSDYGEYIVEYEKLYAKGKINDLLSLNLDINAKMSELWIGYQRFKDVSGNINIKDQIVNMNDISNEKLQAAGHFNLKNGNTKINSSLKNYVVYNTIKPEVNLYIDNATLDVSGPFSDLKGSVVLTPSMTTIDSTYIGDTEGKIDINNSVLEFREFTLRESSVSGTYDMKTGLADVKLTLMEPDIPKLFKIPDLTFGTASELTLKGDLNKFDLSGDIRFGNISYKGYKLPSMDAEVQYQDGDVDRLFKYGTFNIKDLIVRGDNREELFRTNTQFDLENIDIDYKMENQKFSLDSVQDLKEKGYSGDIVMDFSFKGKPEDFSTNLRIVSDKLVLSGFPVENLDIDASANNQGVNVGQFYMEYEKNPLLVNGYLNFPTVNYNVSVLAKNFNLSFLGLDPNVKEAGGIADIDIVFSPQETKGQFLLNNFNYKTKDEVTEVSDVNADIGMDHRKLTINRLDGGYNKGTFSVDGNLDIPSIPANFMETKRIELGKIDLNATLNRVGIKYGKDIDAVLTGDFVFTENRLYGNVTAESGEIRAIPDFGGNASESSSEAEKSRIAKDKTIVEGVIEEVVDKIMKQYMVDINIHSQKNVNLNIPSVSLVRNIKGSIVGDSRLLYEDGQIGLVGVYSLNQGSFMLNNNLFKIDYAEVRFPEPSPGTLYEVNPFVVFTASTRVNGERVEVELSGKTDNPNIKFTSDSGLTREQIVSLLAFNTKADNTDPDKIEDQDGAVVIGSVLNTALNQLIFSPVTGKIGETFGLSNVSISTDFEKSSKGENYSGATTLYIQDNLYKDKWYWNLQVKFPFQTKTQNGSATNPIGYNAWVNYNVFDGLELKAGGETVTKRDEITNIRNKNEINYYIGLDFSAKSDSFGGLWKKLFRGKLQTLTK